MNRKKAIICLSALIFFTFGLQKSYAQCYELVWADEFNYTGFPDPSVWNMEVGNNNGANSEKQWYTRNDSDNCWVDKGYMTITARKENLGGQAYTSARINTKAKAEFMYGKVEARLRLPYGQGIWPAFWMLGGNIDQVGWPKCGEIDIMELIGGSGSRDRTAYGTPHWADVNGNHAQYGGSKTLPYGKFADSYHIFTIEWTDQRITWFLDGVQFHDMLTTPAALSEFQQEYFIILNLAVGGTWPGYPDATTVFPQKFEVDYVRVYQLANNQKIQGKDSLVAGEKDVSYSLPFAEGRKYLWSVPDGASIAGRADSNLIVVNWGCTQGDLVCNVTNTCGTQSVLSKNITLFQARIEGPTFYDKTAGNLFFFVPEMNETNYLWDIPADASFISNNTGDTVEVAWGTGTGLVNLQISNSCGTSDFSKKIFKYGKYPYPDPDAPFIIPGTINSTDFDFGGEGVAYHDNDISNQGTGPRQDERVDTENQPSFPNVGWITTGEWLEYTIEVPQPGYYKIEMKIASANTGAIGPIRVLINGEQRTADIQVSFTGSWTSFPKVSARLLLLNAEDSVLRIQAVTGGFKLGPITLTIDNSVSVRDINTGKEQLYLYPNPVQDVLNINLVLSKPGDVKIKVMDISGKQILSSKLENVQTEKQKIVLSENIRSLNSGMYFIEISTMDQKYFSKFLKN
jgi:beta-glucanase (GH16 family)